MFVELISYDITQFFFWPILPSAYSAALVPLPEIENISLSTSVTTCLSGSPKRNSIRLIFYSTSLLRLFYQTNSISLSPSLSNVESRPTGREEDREVTHTGSEGATPQNGISVPRRSTGISLSWVRVRALYSPDPSWETKSGLSAHHLCSMAWYEGPTISSNQTFSWLQGDVRFSMKSTLSTSDSPR